MDQGQEKLLRVDQVARRLGIKDRQVRRLVDQGKLEAVRLSERGIRIPESALQRFAWWLKRLVRDKVPPNQRNFFESTEL